MANRLFRLDTPVGQIEVRELADPPLSRRAGIRLLPFHRGRLLSLRLACCRSTVK
jgi:hypothetical protein